MELMAGLLRYKRKSMQTLNGVKLVTLRRVAYRLVTLFPLMLIGCSDEHHSRSRCFSEANRHAYADISGTNSEDLDLESILRRVAVLDMTVITPGAGITLEHAHTMDILRRKYKVNIPTPAITNKSSNYCADSVRNRLKYIQAAIDSPHQIIWAMRGGFGTNMLLEHMDKWPIPRKKKILVGFSDTTSLQLFVTQKWGWKSIHAPVLIHLSNKVFSRDKFETLLGILEGTVRRYEINNVIPINAAARLQKSVTGLLTGGNLTLLEASIGTCWEVDVKDKILCIEDIYMKPWWIYRSMYHLKESGRLNGAKAIIFGRFVKTGVSQREIGNTLASFAETLDIPVYVTDQFGHGNHNMPLVYNAVATVHNNRMSIDINWDE